MSVIRIVRFSSRAFFAMAAALLAGCAMIYDAATNPKDKPRPIVGEPLSALTWVRQIEFHDGNLLASISGEWSGIAVIDTSADTVTALLRPFTFDDSYISPWSIASFRDSLLYATHPYGGFVRVVDSSGAWATVQAASPTSANLRALQPTADGLLLFDPYGRDIRSVSGQTSTLRLRLGATQNLRSVALSGNLLLVTRAHSRDMVVGDATSGTVTDSIPFDSLPGRPGLRRNPELVVVHNGRIFVSLLVTDTVSLPDTSIVAVFDAATLALDTVLKLKYTYRTVDTEYPCMPRVANGKWYLPGFSVGAYDQAGVEVIDLNTAKSLPEAVSAWDFSGQRIHYFLPAGNGKAYGLIDAGGYRKVQRVAY